MYIDVRPLEVFLCFAFLILKPWEKNLRGKTLYFFNFDMSVISWGYTSRRSGKHHKSETQYTYNGLTNALLILSTDFEYFGIIKPQFLLLKAHILIHMKA